MRVRALLAMLLFAVTAPAADRIPVLIDTDIGADIDDAFALALALASPELDVVGVTTVGGGNPFDPYVGQRKDRDDHRAWLVCRFLTQAGAKPIPVAAGADPQPKSPIGLADPVPPPPGRHLQPHAQAGQGVRRRTDGEARRRTVTA